MPNIAIRQVEGQEMLDILYQLDNYAFHPTPPFPNREEWEGRIKTRIGPKYFAVFEDGEGVELHAVRPAEAGPDGPVLARGADADAVKVHAPDRAGLNGVIVHVLAIDRKFARPIASVLEDCGRVRAFEVLLLVKVGQVHERPACVDNKLVAVLAGMVGIKHELDTVVAIAWGVARLRLDDQLAHVSVLGVVRVGN